jgi:exopolysaccharide biosynthesis polyprenyl glycosylphosphotransferase
VTTVSDTVTRAQGMASRRRHRGDVVRRKLVVADLLGLAVAFGALQVGIGSGGGDGDRVAAPDEALLFLVMLPLWIVLARAMGLYDRDEERPEHTTVDDVVGIFQLATAFVWAVFVTSFATRTADPDLGKWIAFWVLAIAFVSVARSIARVVARRDAGYVQNAVIVGTDRIGQLLGRKLVHHPEYRIRVVGFVDARPRDLRADLAHVPVLGSAETLVELAERHDLDRVFVGFSGPPDRQMMEIVRQLQIGRLQVDIIPRFFETLGPRTTVTSIEGLQLITLPHIRLGREELALKRVFDTVVAALLLLLAAPLLVVLALWVKLDSPGPVFFRQTRLGLNQRPFETLKFRTMRVETSADDHHEYIRRSLNGDAAAAAEPGGLYKLDREDAVTRAGRSLRRTSLDELPQLLNVVRGEMSLVGPRPCIPYETELFEPHHFERFNVPAGITGLWQVKARARSTFAEALEMDVLYARSWSFWLDVRLLLQTPLQMLRSRATA